jgi:hypothetical protein
VLDTPAGLSILFSIIIGFICLELKIIKPELLLLSSPLWFFSYFYSLLRTRFFPRKVFSLHLMGFTDFSLRLHNTGLFFLFVVIRELVWESIDIFRGEFSVNRLG